MGMKAAMGAPLHVPGELCACFWFRAVETFAARVVLPSYMVNLVVVEEGTRGGGGGTLAWDSRDCDQ